MIVSLGAILIVRILSIFKVLAFSSIKVAIILELSQILITMMFMSEMSMEISTKFLYSLTIYTIRGLHQTLSIVFRLLF